MRLYACRKPIRAFAAAMLIVAALLALAGCRSASAAEGPALNTPRMPAGMFSPTPEATQELTPEPTEYVAVTGVDPEAAEAFAADEFKSLLSFVAAFDFDTERPYAEEIASHGEELIAFEERFFDEARTALCLAAEHTASAFGVEIKNTDFQGDAPEWQLVAALAWACGEQQTAKLLRSGCTVDIDYKDDKLTARLSFADVNDITAAAEPEEGFSARMIYSYFLTVFDDKLVPKDYQMPELGEDYLQTISFPLARMYFYNSWYGPRQYSTRYHLGMDIHSTADTRIFSCTEGTVTAIGFNEIAGYYVVVTDPAGYEYHYYHMIRRTEHVSVGDTVERGEVIGNVGSTGNSDGYHLHLSIITPEHIHLNPYYVMCAVRDMGG